MTTFGITRSKNEVDIIEPSIRRMLAQVDHIIIGDDSTDGTKEILETLPVTLLEDKALNVEQCHVMTAYAQMARDQGADWVVVFDIDEVWHASTGRIADQLAEIDEHASIATATLLTHCVTTEDDPNDPDPISRMSWRSVAALPLKKVACRTREDLVIGHGNHNVTYTNLPSAPLIVDSVLGARHFPYRTPEQFIKRVEGAWPSLRDSGLPESHGAHMWAYGRHLDEFGHEGLRDWFRNGFTFNDPQNNPDIVFDPAPPLPPLDDLTT